MKSFLLSILLLSLSSYGLAQESQGNSIYQYNSKYDNYSQRNSTKQNTQQSINQNSYTNSANTSLSNNNVSDNSTILNNISGNAKNNGEPCYYVKEITDFNKKLHEMNNIDKIVPLNNSNN